MKKKTFLQACELGAELYGKKGGSRKKVSPIHNKVSKKNVRDVYDRFYKDQVAALYRAVQGHG